MGQHKYNDAYNKGFKDGQNHAVDYLLDRMSYLVWEEPDEKQEAYNEVLEDISKILRERFITKVNEVKND